MIQMRNMGVAILDMLLKSSKINKLQYNQMYKKRLYVEWEIVLWSDLNKSRANSKPANFVTNVTGPIILHSNPECVVGLNRIINMSFTWFNINPDYNNQLIKYSSDNGRKSHFQQESIITPILICSWKMQL